MNSRDNFPYYGVVIEGTMKCQHLVERFLPIIKSLNDLIYTSIVEDFPTFFSQYTKDVFYLDINWDSEMCHDLLDRLFDELDGLAPANHYFGSHPGDGACYGFFETLPED
jgi:hypothetical protein